MTRSSFTTAPPTATRPRAIAAGVLWERVDCYVLEDGRRVISKRGELRALRGVENGTGRGVEDGNLKRYLGGLPKRYGHLASEDGTSFTLPQGGATGIGFTPAHFVNVLRAYAMSSEKGELRDSQKPMAGRALDLLCLLADKGIETLIDEACGVRVALRDEDGERERLEAENAILRARIEALGPTGGVIGRERARLWILDPLREAARIRCAVDNAFDQKVFLREFRDMEGQVRLHVGLPAVIEVGKWENLPMGQLFERALQKAIEIRGRMRRLSKRLAREYAERAAQLSLPVGAR